MIFKLIALCVILSSQTIQSIQGVRDWQICRQKSFFWCTEMCGLTGAGDVGHGKCSITGFCICPKSVTPPSFCKEASTYDYHEVFNCQRLRSLCSFGQQNLTPDSIRPYVCTDEHRKRTSLEERPMKYCVCFHN